MARRNENGKNSRITLASLSGVRLPPLPPSRSIYSAVRVRARPPHSGAQRREIKMFMREALAPSHPRARARTTSASRPRLIQIHLQEERVMIFWGKI